MTRLQRLLANIEPIPDRMALRVAQAANDFELRAVVLNDRQLYEQQLAQFYCHLECAILGIADRPASLNFDLQRCLTLIQRKYGHNTRAAVFDVVRTGVAGGLPDVLRSVADQYSREQTENLIGMTVESYWKHRTPAQLLADMDEYVCRYRSLLPSEMREKGAVRIKGEFRALLKQHPFAIRDVRRSTRAHVSPSDE